MTVLEPIVLLILYVRSRKLEEYSNHFNYRVIYQRAEAASHYNISVGTLWSYGIYMYNNILKWCVPV